MTLNLQRVNVTMERFNETMERSNETMERFNETMERFNETLQKGFERVNETLQTGLGRLDETMTRFEFFLNHLVSPRLSITSDSQDSFMMAASVDPSVVSVALSEGSLPVGDDSFVATV